MSITLAGLPTFPMIANRRTPGIVSRRISRRLVARSVPWLDSPVRFPPGRARLATRPVATGSPGNEDDRNSVRRLPCRLNCLGPIGHNHIDLLSDELGRELVGAFS